jgi:hypothetical protein
MLIAGMTLAPNHAMRWEMGSYELSKAKTALHGKLGEGWIDSTSGVYRFAQAPWIDIQNIPRDDREAFAYCCSRGDLLREHEYADVAWVEEARTDYHERLSRLTARLIDAEAHPGAVEALLAEATYVLSRSAIAALRPSNPSTSVLSSTEAGPAETLLARLEGELGDPAARRAQITPDLTQLIDTIEERAIARRPYRMELLQRASLLLNFFHNTLHIEVENHVWRLANSRMYASDINGAFAELRPWVESPDASPGALCIAGLLNLRLGWVDAAQAVFTAALERNRSPEFEVILHEKRDVQIPQGQGENRSELAHRLQDSQYFDALSTGARASIYCNEARTASPLSSLRLYQKARDLDLGAENPHYELNVARAAVRVGKPELVREHLATFDEMLQTQTAISLHYAQMTVRAEQIEANQTDSLAKSAPDRRARLQEADTLYAAVIDGQLRGGDIPAACAAWLKRARVALALSHPDLAFGHAHAVTKLAPNRCERFLQDANRLERTAGAPLDDRQKARLAADAFAKVTSIERGLPAPLLPYDASQPVAGTR